MCRCVHVSDSLILGGEAVGEGGGRPSSAGGGAAGSEEIFQVRSRSRPDPAKNFGLSP